MTTVLLFFIVISVLIVVHELGHFIAAKAFGIKVDEFALGFPPRIASIQRGETRYSLNAIPLGGYVKMTGEEDPTHPRSLAGRSRAQRATVIVAGVAMNFFLTILLFIVFFSFPAEMVGSRVQIVEVVEGTPAAQAGLQPGDIFLLADPKFELGDLAVIPSDDSARKTLAERYGGQPIETLSDLTRYTDANLGREVSFLVSRNDKPVIATLIPRPNPPPGQGPMGVAIRQMGGHIETSFDPNWNAIPESFRQVGRFVTSMDEVVGNLFSVEGREGLAGPIGIAQITGEVADTGWLPFIGFVAILSLNLAIINILPIPALDGGRLLFLLLEVVRGGRRVPPEKEAVIHLAGFIVLITIIILISFNDIQRLVSGESILP